MASRWWVAGGNGNWSSTTNWSDTSGGSSGFSVPVSGDDANIDNNSGTGTVTLDISPTVGTLTLIGFGGTIAYGANTISLDGTGTVFYGDTTYTSTGAKTIYLTYSGSTSTGIQPNATTESNSISFVITAGSYNFSLLTGDHVKNLDFSNGGSSTYTGSWLDSNAAVTYYGDLILKTGMTVTGSGGAIFEASSGTQKITSAGVTIARYFGFTGTATYQLQDALTISSTSASSLSGGTLDLNGKTFTMTAGAFTSGSGTFAFGSGNLTFTNSGAVFTSYGGTTVTGTPNIYLSYTGATATSIATGAPTEANTFNFIITAGSYSFSFASGDATRNIDFSNGGTSTYTGAWAGGANTLTCYGNLTLKSGMTSTGTGTMTFAATSGTKTITSNGVSHDRPITFNGSGGTFQLQDAFTTGSTRTTTLTAGTLDLNGKTYTTGLYASTGTNTIAFGSGNITVTGSGTSFSGSGSTSVTGTPNVYLSYSGATAVTLSAGATTEANAINFIITAGSYSLSITTNRTVKNLDFSNGGTSTYTGTWAGGANPFNCYGNLTLKSGMSVTGTGTISFLASSGINTITSAGLTTTHPMTFGGAGTYKLLDALNIGTTRTITITLGTFDANSYNVTAGSMSSNNSNTRTIAVGSGTWTLGNSGASVWTVGSAVGLTVTGTGTISMTSASAKTFVGGGAAYTNITLNQGGAGALTINGSNTFKNITNTYSATGATQITFQASTTNTVSNFTATGTSGKVLTIISSSAGTQATLSKSSGTVSVDYCAIKDSAATGGASWYAGANSTNNGNNTGWIFTAPPAPSANGNFLLLM